MTGKVKGPSGVNGDGDTLMDYRQITRPLLIHFDALLMNLMAFCWDKPGKRTFRSRTLRNALKGSPIADLLSQRKLVNEMKTCS